MSDKLFLQFQDAESDHILWFHVSDNQLLQSGNQAIEKLAELNDKYSGIHAIALVPSCDCLVTQVSIPTRQRRQQLKAIPFAVEEQLAGDIEEMHFAIGKRRNDGILPVVAVAKNKMENWIQMLTEAGFKTHAMLPLSGLLEAPDDAWSIYQLDDSFLINQNGDCWVSDAEQAAMMLQLSLQKIDDDEQPGLLFWGSGDVPGWVSGLGLQLSEQKVQNAHQALLARFDQQCINLLQGNFEIQDDWHAGWKVWRRAAVFAMIAILLKLSMMAFNLISLNAENNYLTKEIAQIYQQVAPGARVTAFPERQMRQLLAQLQGGENKSGSLMVMLGQLGDSLTTIPDIRPTNLNYDSTRGEIRLDLIVSNLPVLDQLKEHLVARGFSVEIGGASAQGNDYTGRLIIRSGS